MKCDYCGQYDHLESSCPSKKTDRRTEMGIAVFFLLTLGLFWVLGTIGGFIWSALRAGAQFGDDIWPQTWNVIRGKKKDDGESTSV